MATGQPFALSLSVRHEKRRIFQKTLSSKDYEFPDEFCEDFKRHFEQWPSYLGYDRTFSKHDWEAIQEIVSEQSCALVMWTAKPISRYRFGIVLLGNKSRFIDEIERMERKAALTDRYIRLSRIGPYGMVSDRTFSAREANNTDGTPRLRAFFNAQIEDLWWSNRSFSLGERIREILPATQSID